MKVSWSCAIREGVTIQPSAGFYNLFNFANFDLPGNALNGLLKGAAGQINGTTRVDHNVDRVGVGTGVYSLGAPRQLEFGLRITSKAKSPDCLRFDLIDSATAWGGTLFERK